MNILGREFVTEQMPSGWVICERWIDGVLNIIDNKLSNRKHAQIKLQILSDCLVKDCQKLGKSPDQYWQDLNGTVFAQFISDIR